MLPCIVPALYPHCKSLNKLKNNFNLLFAPLESNTATANLKVWMSPCHLISDHEHDEMRPMHQPSSRRRNLGMNTQGKQPWNAKQIRTLQTPCFKCWDNPHRQPHHSHAFVQATTQQLGS